MSGLVNSFFEFKFIELESSVFNKNQFSLEEGSISLMFKILQNLCALVQMVNSCKKQRKSRKWISHKK